MRTHFAAVAALLCALSGAPAAQTQTRDQPAGRPSAAPSDAAALAEGWNSLAAGQREAAARAAAQVLSRAPWNHAAMALRIEALSAIDPLRGLDAYEAWLAKRPREDAGLLEPAPRATLRQIAGGPDAGLRHDAVRLLAAAGVPPPPGAGEAGDQLATDAARAKDGDAAALKRLDAAVTAGTGDPAALAGSLESAGPPGTPLLMRMLTAPAGPSRAAAAAALGRRKIEGAKPALEKLTTDPDPHVRSTATVALARMGDDKAMTVVLKMLETDVPDLRIMAAEAFEGQNGPWVAAIMPLLENRDGVTRLQAARLIAPVNPEAARRTLQEAAGDTNPVIRAEAARVMADVSPTSPDVIDVTQARRLLRDADPAVRLHAAGALLAAARAGY